MSWSDGCRTFRSVVAPLVRSVIARANRWIERQRPINRAGYGRRYRSPPVASAPHLPASLMLTALLRDGAEERGSLLVTVPGAIEMS